LPAVATAARMGHRTLFEVNGLPSIELKYHYPALHGTPVLEKLRRQEAAVLRRVDQVICPSRVTAEYVRSVSVAPKRVTVIPNGVDTELFAPAAAPEPCSEPPCILYLGTLAEWQGLALLLDALPLVLAQRPVRLKVVGRGRKPQRKALRKRVRKLGLAEWVTLDGARPHRTIPPLLNQAAVCVAPLSLNDRNVTQGCCPLKVLEYMACRRPIVAANLPVVRELVRQDVDALLFTPDDPQDLARALLRLLDEPALAERLAANAYARARQAFTWEQACAALLEVYGGMLLDR
jgi:glycosyltransferase involved in cell wall biosynthesis